MSVVEGDWRLASAAPGLLREFNIAGVLSPADVHVALRLGALGGVQDESVLLAAALAVRAPRLGHVCVDLITIASTVISDRDIPVDVGALPWPGADWVDRVATSALVGPGRPLRLWGDALYLDRYWSDESEVAADLLDRSASEAPDVNVELLRAGVTALFGPAGDGPDLQRVAAAAAVLRRWVVIAGGPGTGKTTTVARVLALLDAQRLAAGGGPSLVALAAPTGRAAARLQESVHVEAGQLPIDAGTRQRLLGLAGVTLHRLLGWTPTQTRFRHNRLNRLPHDVIVVDETSMVSLSLMARLVEAVRPDARLVLVGDPEQLASVEAGAVLGDLVGPAIRGLRMREASRRVLSRAADQEVVASEPHLLGGSGAESGAGSGAGSGSGSATPVGDGIVVIRRVHRYGGDIARLAEAIQRGDADETITVLSAGGPGVGWVSLDISGGAEVSAGAAGLGEAKAAAVAAGRRVVEAARAGRAAEAIEALGAFRLLCAHRRGPAGAATWVARVEGWLGAEIGSVRGWYVGRPVLVTANDYSLRLFNGDTGVAVAAEGGRMVAAFQQGDQIIEVSPSRLATVDTAYAMTIHKAQGSQFGSVAVLLPAPESPILTRELLYTAVTRARTRVIVVGTEEAIRVAVGRPIARSSGLGRRLWGS